MVEIWMKRFPVEVYDQKGEEGEQRKQHYVDERAGCDTPQVSAGPGWRFHKGNAAERPQHNRVGLPAGLPAGKRMTKFVQQHNTKQGQIFECCPDWIVIPLREPCHFKRGDNEPGEVQIDAYSGQTKYWQGPFHWGRRIGSSNINNGASIKAVNCYCGDDRDSRLRTRARARMKDAAEE